MRDYSNFLINRFVLCYFCKGINEVHIVFDSPGHGMHTPKEFEQNRRDGSQSSEHIHTQFSDETVVPKNWQDLLRCRSCKRLLVLYLGASFISINN